MEIEAKHVQYVHSMFDDKKDACIVKEIRHAPDGSKTKHLRVLADFQRDWYITREGNRGHKDKKESETLKKLQKFSSNTRTMPMRISRMLGGNLKNPRLKQLCQSPYIYGTDIAPETIIKQRYIDKWHKSSASDVAVLDIETDMLGGPLDEKGFGNIISISLTQKDKVYLVSTRGLVSSLGNDETIKAKVHEAFHKYLGKYIEARNLVLDFEIVDNELEAVRAVLAKAHAWQPDIVACWNINFDVPKMLRVLKKYGVDPGTVFCDPSIPPEFRFVDYIEGPASRITASGRTHNFSPSERWHTLIAPSHFTWVCAMGTYASIRKAKGKDKSYALDDILFKELGERKLNFTVADGYAKGAWHIFMQKNYPLEYLIYNVFDCVGVEILDEKTLDLTITLNELCGASTISSFSSTPRQLADDLHFFFLKHGRVICSTSNKMATEEDARIIGMDGWIITLITHLVADNGLEVIKDMEGLRTMLRAYVSDLDIRSAYPWGEIVCNASKATLRKELIRIEGVTVQDRKLVGLNLTGGTTNAASYCRKIHKTPTLTEISKAIAEELIAHQKAA